jgi:putative sigma-54 modulation protein
MLNIQVQAGFAVSETLQQLIEEKVGKLETYYDRILTAEVFLKSEENRHKQSLEQTTELRLQVPGQILHAEDHSETFEKSLPAAVEKMRKQLIKYKEHVRPHQ